MADEVDLLLKFCEEEWTQRRQSETQRATITNYVITISAATLVFIGQKGFTLFSLPLAIFLVIIGIYGAITSAKLYERWLFSSNRAHFLYRRIDELRPDALLLDTRRSADQKYHHFLARVRLHWLWTSLHIAIIIFGLVCAVIIFAKAK